MTWPEDDADGVPRLRRIFLARAVFAFQLRAFDQLQRQHRDQGLHLGLRHRRLPSFDLHAHVSFSIVFSTAFSNAAAVGASWYLISPTSDAVCSHWWISAASEPTKAAARGLMMNPSESKPISTTSWSLKSRILSAKMWKALV